MLGTHKAHLASPLHPRFFSSQLRRQPPEIEADTGTNGPAQQQAANGLSARLCAAHGLALHAAVAAVVCSVAEDVRAGQAG